MAYYVAHLPGGRNSEHFDLWWSRVQHGAFDLTGHNQTVVLKAHHDINRVRRDIAGLSPGKFFHIELEKITRSSAARQHRWHLRTIQQFYDDFLDVDIDPDFEDTVDGVGGRRSRSE